MAHQQDIIIVDIHVGKCLTHHCSQHIASLEQVVHTTRLRTFHNGTLCFGILAPQMFGHHFIDRQRQPQFVGVLTGVNLLSKPRITLEDTLLERLFLDIVEAECYLLITLIAIVVVTLQVGFLLVGNHLAHQINGRVVLSAIARTFLRLDGHFTKRTIVRSQSDGHLSGSLWIHVDHLLTITH